MGDPPSPPCSPKWPCCQNQQGHASRSFHAQRGDAAIIRSSHASFAFRSQYTNLVAILANAILFSQDNYKSQYIFLVSPLELGDGKDLATGADRLELGGLVDLAVDRSARSDRNTWPLTALFAGIESRKPSVAGSALQVIDCPTQSKHVGFR